MALNVVELSDVMHFIDTIEDKRMKTLLDTMRFDYTQYLEIGSIEDCKNYKILCDIPMSQINKLLQATNKACIDEIDALKKEVEWLKENKQPKPVNRHNSKGSKQK